MQGNPERCWHTPKMVIMALQESFVVVSSQSNGHRRLVCHWMKCWGSGNVGAALRSRDMNLCPWTVQSKDFSVAVFKDSIVLCPTEGSVLCLTQHSNGIRCFWFCSAREWTIRVWRLENAGGKSKIRINIFSLIYICGHRCWDSNLLTVMLTTKPTVSPIIKGFDVSIRRRPCK